MRTAIALTGLLGLLLTGCTPEAELHDFDGDGAPDSFDCAPADPTVSQLHQDPVGDEHDSNCDGTDGVDEDGDGYPGNAPPESGARDCDDGNASISPGEEEIVNDGWDNDCDGFEAIDLDGDGALLGTADCDDGDPTTWTGAPELPDLVDNDCDIEVDEGTVLADDDGDGACEGADLGSGLQCRTEAEVPGDCDDVQSSVHPYDQDADGSSPCTGDCDDSDPGRSPDLVEICNGTDENCDGELPDWELDTDLDGWRPCQGDCDDNDPGLTADDVDADGYSTCSGDCDDSDPALQAADADGDGFTTCSGDCDDLDPLASPALVEACNGWDDDCDPNTGGDESDADGDGDPACADCNDGDATLTSFDLDADGWSSCAGDCNDLLATTYPGAFDVVDGVGDANCDGVDGVDVDGDGDASAASGGLDCDDGDPALNAADGDADGSSTCDGDCDDSDPQIEALDLDGDAVTTCAGDCDDQEASVFPGATEVCDLFDTDCDVTTTLSGDATDADGDGWAACAECDDTNSATAPGAVEVCDGEDNDCDGLVVPHGPNGEQDNDGDGFVDCSPWVGTLFSGGGDCNDFDPLILPGALDSCDGVDTDCNGVVDDAGDQDGDGVCFGDCDDTDPTVYPGQWEDPSDGVDSDCDGTDLTGLATSGDSLLVDQASNFDAGPVVTLDFDGDGLMDLAIGVKDADGYDGRVYLVRGVDLWSQATWALPTEAYTVLVGDGNDRLGTSLAVADLDGDGRDDLLIGATQNAQNTRKPGAVYYMRGSTLDNGGTRYMGYQSNARLEGITNLDATGTSVAAGGDLDGDGVPDVVIGAPDADPNGSKSGRVYICSGAWIAQGGTRSLGSAFGRINGASANDELGRGVSIGGDFDGDGVPDIVAGRAHTAYVHLGFALTAGGTTSTASAHATLTGGGWINKAITPIGDLTGDGLGDLLIGSFGVSSASGRAWIMSGATLSVLGSYNLTTAAWAQFNGLAGDGLGWSVAGGFDFDDDGLDDIVLGARNSNRAYVWSRSAITAGTTHTAADATWAFAGSSGAYAGFSVAVGDLDQDGVDDLVVRGDGQGGRTWVMLSTY